MPLNWHLRSDSQKKHWGKTPIFIVALLALLSIRSVIPHFPESVAARVSATDVSSHYPRSRFDDDAAQFLPPVHAVQLWLPVQTRAALGVPPILALCFPTKGVHYNRPPPAL
jgi:hypothetical protein